MEYGLIQPNKPLHQVPPLYNKQFYCGNLLQYLSFVLTSIFIKLNNLFNQSRWLHFFMCSQNLKHCFLISEFIYNRVFLYFLITFNFICQLISALVIVNVRFCNNTLSQICVTNVNMDRVFRYALSNPIQLVLLLLYQYIECYIMYE